ncbi:MAG: mannose-1-phosphate guanyltransferase, partial [Actinomycetota bacterium]|nr:mannose-1-phosphate guanyltransferase [Actinomycetota bacterium]
VLSSRVAEVVRTSNAQLGAVIDPDGEHITIIDDEGQVLTDSQALLVFVTLVCGARPGARVALPVSVTQAAEKIAHDAGAEVVWTKQSPANLMDVAASDDVTLAANLDGGFIFPEFMPAYDGAAAFVNLLALLAHSGQRLSKVVAGLPRIHVAHETIVTPWEEKGVLMRKFVERVKDRDVLLVDGVKVFLDDSWALVLPDPEEPVTHVWAEGDSDSKARGLAQEYARRIRQILR